MQGWWLACPARRFGAQADHGRGIFEMIRSILAAVAALMRAMPRYVLERVRVAGEWVSRLVAVPAPGYEAGPAMPPADDGDAEHLQAIKTAAGHLAAGDVPPNAAMALLTRDDIIWLGTMTKRMQAIVVASSDRDLRAHIRGTKMIRGVLNHDPRAVSDYRAAKDRERIVQGEKRVMRPSAA